MFPTLTWQQEALALLHTRYNVQLAEDAVTLVPVDYMPTGRFSFTLATTAGARYYTENPILLHYSRRDIGGVFVNHKPVVLATDGDSVESCLQSFMTKYGIALDTGIFSEASLAATIDLSTESATDISLEVVNDRSELWYGTLVFEATADANRIASVFTTIEPLVADYPESDAIGVADTFTTYGIVLTLAENSPLRTIEAGDTPDAASLFQMASAIQPLDYNTAWHLLTDSTVLYNGSSTTTTIEGLDPSLLPTFGTKVLVLQSPAVSSKLYFSYS